MKILKILLFAILFLPLATQGNNQSNAQHISAEPLLLKHQFKITLKPDSNELSVRDTITLPDNGQSAFTFQLNSLFHLRYKNRPLHPVRTANGVSSYHIAASASREIVLNYKGKLESTPDCQWLEQTCVLLNETGAFLDGNSHWYPDITSALHSFNMSIELPKKWVSLSQGKQTKTGWQEDQPQRAIYLLAGPFKVYESQPDPAKPKAMVYLRQDAPKLAQKYLQATHQYLEQYSRMLGAYPYAKFATVESFWETGWGMPSFTLLGPKVMRLPFILHSSFPHEILHNWWGNGVYVDSRDGNWSEGLTAYLADHYNKPSKAERIAYRRDALQKYQAYTTAGGDFPLRNFRGRHNRTTQAVGYSKALMMFHMLRKQLGSQQFFSGLKSFYRDYQFRFASFTDLQQAFSTSGDSKNKHELDTFFQQWRDKSGAPQLSITDHQIEQQASGTTGELTVKLTLRQTQTGGQHFSFDIPIKIQDKNGNINHQTLRMDKAEQQYTLSLDASARQLLIDPHFDLLRTPDRYEVPATINMLLNQQAKTFILNSNTPNDMKKAWQELFSMLSYGQKNTALQYSDDKTTAATEVIVLLGNDHAMLKNLTSSPEKLTKSIKRNLSKDVSSLLDRVKYNHNRHALVLTLRKGKKQIILLEASTPKAVRSLARKLPHYGKYSYILFDNSTGRNVAKGQWQVTDSPMILQLRQ